MRRPSMQNTNVPTVTVHLPADLVARMDEMKKYREQDRNRSVPEIVEELCRSYVQVREMAAEDLARREELDRSYLEDPYDYPDDFSPKEAPTEGAG
jgi:hypothetical protein